MPPGEPASEPVHDPRRLPLVGREAELGQLLSGFEAASNGQGQVIMLVGEPGIGKSALCQRLATETIAQDGMPLFGHCYEVGSSALPYQPFVEALTAYAREQEPETLALELGSRAAELARIVPLITERLEVEVSPPGDPAQERLLLMRAITDFLRDVAATRPLVLILEDLHDADGGSLDLLMHVARQVDTARLLVVGTYRDVEVDRAHPLSAAVAELRRSTTFTRIRLQGLPLEDVHELLRTASQQQVSATLAELVYQRTDGNPLFVHELLRFALEDGLIERRDGALRRVGEDALAGRIPEGLRDVVGKRLSRLGRDTNRVLSVASVIGREFQVEVLQDVLLMTTEDLEAALEEAVVAGIVEERAVSGRSVTYRFAHAFFRQTLYDEIIAPRRIRLHREVASVLERRYARHLREHASELAQHFAFSSGADDLAKAVAYSEMAAQQASSVFAFGEAARHLERALQIQELVDDGEPTQRCDLLIALSQALGPSGETQRVIEEVVPAAVALAEQLGEHQRAFRGCWIAVNCLDIYGGVAARARPEYAAWAERADRHAKPGGLDKVYALIMLAHAAAGQGRRHERDALMSQAVELAHQQNNADTLFFTVSQALLTGPAQRWSERVMLAEQATRWQRDGVTARALAVVLFHSGGLELSRGNRPRAEELWHQLEELAERRRDAWLALFARQAGLVLPIIDGDFETADVRLDRFLHFVEDVGAGVRGRRFRLVLSFWPWLELGRASEWLAGFQEFRRVAGAPSGSSDLQPMAALCHARLGHLDEAHSLIGPHLDNAAANLGEEYCEAGYSLPLLETAILLGHRAAADAIAAGLECIAGLSAGDWFYTSVARHLGSAARLNGDRRRARAYYEQAIEACAKIAFRPELALAHLDLAELLVIEPARNDLLEARKHLDIAIGELRQMKMQPGLERALKLAESPQLSGLTAAARTGLSSRERDVAALLAAGKSNREIADALVITEGTVEVHVKHILSKLGYRSRAQVAAWFVQHEVLTNRHAATD